MRIGSVQIVSPVLEPMKLSEKTATIVRITQGEPFVIDRTYGNYTIRGCRPGERYVAMKIRAARGTAGTKESFKEWEISAADIANDLAGECNNFIWGIGSSVTGEIIEGSEADPTAPITSQTVRGFAGVFVSEFNEPSEAELEKAHELLRMSDEQLILVGDNVDGQFHNPLHIHAGFREAAKRQGEEREWLHSVKNAPNCPYCSSKLKSSTATVCATCLRDISPQNAAERSDKGAKRGPKAKTKEAASAAA